MTHEQARVSASGHAHPSTDPRHMSSCGEGRPSTSQPSRRCRHESRAPVFDIPQRRPIGVRNVGLTTSIVFAASEEVVPARKSTRAFGRGAMRLSQRYLSRARMAMHATSVWAGAPPSGANARGWKISRKTCSLRTRRSLARAECQSTHGYLLTGGQDEGEAGAGESGAAVGLNEVSSV